MMLENNDIIEGIIKGDRGIFDSVFKSYHPGLCAFAWGYVRSRDASKEIVQELFLYLWENHEKLAIKSSLKAYLYRSVHNRCLNYIRDIVSFSNKEVQIDQLRKQADLLFIELPDSIFDKAFSEEIERELELVIDALPEQCRSIFNLSRFDNLSYPEIAARLNVSLSTIKTQMSRAMHVLQKKMNKYLQ